MKIVRFKTPAGPRVGFVRGDEIVDPLAVLAADDAAVAYFADTIAFIKGGDVARTCARQLIENASPSAWRRTGDVELLAPIVPRTILCTGSNYRAHNAEKKNTPISGKEPEFFVLTADNVIGPEVAIVHDASYTQKLDCETELAIVIGKEGKHIPRETALAYVFGYTILNDVTARDLQVRSTAEGFVWYELGRGKMFDCSAPLGPAIVTTDDIPDPQSLMVRTRINGEPRQRSSTADMIWSCADLIHFFSKGLTLRPGMIISTGTPAGTAWSSDKELGGKWIPEQGLVPATRYCQAGDVVESEIDGIGVLRNPIVGR